MRRYGMLLKSSATAVLLWAMCLCAGAVGAATTEPTTSPAAADCAVQPAQPSKGVVEGLWDELCRRLPSAVEVGQASASVLWRAFWTIVAIGIAALVAYGVRAVVGLLMRPLKWRSEATNKRIATIKSLVNSIITYVVLIGAGFWILKGVWDVDTSSLVVGTAVLGAAFGFGSQGLVQDIINGVSLLMEDQLRIGDWVTISGMSGTVQNVGLRTIHIRTPDGQVHILFNRAISQLSTYAEGCVRLMVDVHVAEGAQLPAAQRVLASAGRAIAEQFGYVLGEPELCVVSVPAGGDASVGAAGAIQLVRGEFRVRPAARDEFAILVVKRLEGALGDEKIAVGRLGIAVHAHA